jgi:hypothetical protein
MLRFWRANKIVALATRLMYNGKLTLGESCASPRAQGSRFQEERSS